MIPPKRRLCSGGVCKAFCRPHGDIVSAVRAKVNETAFKRVASRLRARSFFCFEDKWAPDPERLAEKLTAIRRNRRTGVVGRQEHDAAGDCD